MKLSTWKGFVVTDRMAHTLLDRRPISLRSGALGAMKVFIVYTCAAIVFATVSIAQDSALRGSRSKDQVAASTELRVSAVR